MMPSLRTELLREEVSDKVMAMETGQPVGRSSECSTGEVGPTTSLAPDKPIAEAVRARMALQRRRDTSPELALRRALHRIGLRFRVDYPLPDIPRRRADVVFTRVGLAVFVDGCFWHDCPEHGTRPRSRAAWWEEKLRRNVERDRDTDSRLTNAGWTVVRFWEHADMEGAAVEVQRTYRRLLVSRQRRGGPSLTTAGRSG